MTSFPTQGTTGTGISLDDVLARLATIVLSAQPVDEVLAQLSQIAKDHLTGALEVSITVVSGSRASSAAFTGQLAADLDERQFAQGYGPCLDAAQSAATQVISDATTEQRWPDWTPAACARGVRSLLAVPLPLQSSIIAGLNVYSASAHAFDEKAVERAQTFAGYAAIALANAQTHADAHELAEQMREAMASRAVIEQAKGIIMVSRRCSSEVAFNVIRDASMQSNRKLRVVAEALVASATAPSAPF